MNDTEPKLAASPSAQPSGAPEVQVSLEEVQKLAKQMWKGEPIRGRVLRFGAAVLGLVDASLATAPSGAPEVQPVAYGISYEGHIVFNELYGTQEAAQQVVDRRNEKFGTDGNRTVVPFFATAPTPSGAPADTTKDEITLRVSEKVWPDGSRSLVIDDPAALAGAPSVQEGESP